VKSPPQGVCKQSLEEPTGKAACRTEVREDKVSNLSFLGDALSLVRSGRSCGLATFSCLEGGQGNWPPVALCP
jgi:hypothetical protein